MRIGWPTCAATALALALAVSHATGASAAPAAGGAEAPAQAEGSQQPAATSPPASTAPPQPASPATPTAISPLSNEITLTTWAHPEIAGTIYAEPNPHSRRVAGIDLLTSDGFQEVYMLLDAYVDPEGREWVKVRVPGRPNGRTGWMLRELLGSFHHTHWRIVVSLSQRRMRIYYDGTIRRVYPVGVGKPSTPTPSGHFWIRELFKVAERNSPYWPYALGTSDYSTLSEWPGGGVVGIHGPFGEPQRIPGDPSHGCIRMLAPDVAWVGTHVALGTPVDIVPR